MSEMGMRINEVMGKMIFQAGVDYETRPMVVLCASALPDPRYVDYDLLLSYVCLLALEVVGTDAGSGGLWRI